MDDLMLEKERNVKTKFVMLDEAKPGMVLAQTVLTPGGDLLLEKGIVLTELHLKILEEWKIVHITIEDTDDSAAEYNDLGLDLAFGSMTMAPEEEIKIEEASVLVEKAPEEIAGKVAESEKVPHETRETPAEIEFVPPSRDEIKETKVFAQRLRRKAKEALKETLAKLLRGREYDHSRVMGITHEFVQSAIDKRHVFSALAVAGDYNDYLIDHIINVAVLSVITGYMMGKSPDELNRLGEESFLFDIGMARVPREIWDKKERLTEAEQREVRRHTEHSAQMVESMELENKEASLVVLQHHERWDGSGYPQGLTRHQIHEHALIIGMSDVYVAMTSPRKYRSKMIEYDAMRFLLSASGGLFAPNVILAFLRHMSLYPVGSLVELMDGSYAVVIAANPGSPYRPWIRPVQTARGEVLPETEESINLLKHPEIGVKRALSHEEVGFDPLELV